MPDARTVVFDLDNTLVDRDAALMLACEELGIARTRQLQSAVANATSLRALVAQLKKPASYATHLREAMLEHFVPDERVIAMLDRMRSSCRLVLASNGSGSLQRAKLRRCGLQDSFDVILISGEIGQRKPQCEFYRAACAGAHEHAVVFVGDDPVLDVAGPIGIGAQTAWVSRGRSWAGPAITPGFIVSSVIELEEVLACRTTT